MASTYTLNSTSYDGRYLSLSCTQIPDVNTNTSTINWTLTVTGGNEDLYSTGPTTVKINGQEVYYKERVSWSTKVFPAKKGSTSGSLTVAHNSAGNCSVAVSLSTAIYTATVSTQSGTWTLNNIARASSVSCTTAAIGTNPTITISRASSAFTHTLTYTFGSLSGTIVTKTTATSYTGWTIPTTFYNILSDATSGTGTITCTTYNGNTVVGTSTCPFVVTVNTTQNRPTIAPLIVDVNSNTTRLTGNSNILVKYFSNASVISNASATGGASLSVVTISNGSQTITGTSGTFNGVESGTFNFYALDSRGAATSTSLTKPMVEYIRLTCNLSNNRPDVNGNMTVECSGNYFNGSFGAMSNTLTVQYRYKVNGGSNGAWTNMNFMTSGNTYTASAELTGLDYQTQYVFECRAIDALMWAGTNETQVQSTPIFHWGENDFTFEVPVHFAQGFTNDGEGGGGGGGSNEIEGDCTITGNLRLKDPNSNYGNSIYFGDSSYAYISETSDDHLKLRATTLTLDSQVLYLNGSNTYVNGTVLSVPSYGLWAPFLGSGSPSYNTNNGWYMKVGQCVTVGFYIKATVGSGYSSTAVTITNLPFTPMYSAAGGGMCSGATVSAGFNFQSWVAESSGSITARVQACNNTSTTNLGTSASGCFYRTGGGEMTISGTITYLTNA